MANMTGVRDSGSNYQFGDKLIKPSQRFSQFDLSYINTLTAKQGQLIPVYFSYYYPGDEFNYNLESLIRVVNPPVVPLASRQRVFFHFYKVDYTQLWYYFEPMARRGYSGNFEALLPRVTAPLAVFKNGTDNSQGYIFNPMLARGSLADFLGFNFSDYTYQAGDENITVSLPALPFLAYQRIYRDYYFNKNLNIDSPLGAVFLPESDMDLLIQGKSPQNLTLSGTSEQVDEPLNKLDFGTLRYRNWVDDYFTSALPWPMRGDIPVLQIPASSGATLSVKDGNKFFPLSITGWKVGDSFSTLQSTQIQGLSKSLEGQYATVGSLNSGSFPAPGSPTDVNGLLSVNLSDLAIPQTALKLLWTNTLISEKLARTDGTYLQFVKTFFGEHPSHARQHMPQYLGGTYQPIVFQQVLQTSPAETGTLGTVGGQGISSSQGHVGRFRADDFGICMCIMSIMPDTYYCQGWHKEHLYQTQDDLPLPERALLGMQPVTQAEIFYDPRDTNNERNSVLFGYQNRLDELRYRANEIHGEIANPNNKSFSPYTQARIFAEAPNLNENFVSTKGTIRNDWLSAPEEVPYMVQIANRVSAVRQYPYHAPPSALMM